MDLCELRRSPMTIYMDHRGRGRRGRSARGRQRWNREPTRHLTEAATPPQYPVNSFRVSHPNVADFWPGARSGPDGSGGYDYEFVSEPPDELKCSVCLLALRDPSLTSCCGKHFCQSCISRIKNEGKPCPLCQEKDYQLMLDKSIIRRVRELKIKCPNSGRGCEWVGEFGSIERHLDVSCGFVEVTCDYCQSQDILRNSLADHKNTCPARPYRCEYCGFRDKWKFIKGLHQSECKNYPVECPNNCDVGKVQRHELDKHVREECTLREVGCEFECVGCQVCCPQMHIARHLSENVSSHLGMVVSYFQNKLAEKDEELRMCNIKQSRQLLALKASVQSQEREIVGIRKEVQSQGREIAGIRKEVQSQEREIAGIRKEVQSQKKQIEEMEAKMESSVREKVELEIVDMRSIFYKQIFQLLEIIALRNDDLKMPNPERIRTTMFGAATGAALGTAGGAAGDKEIGGALLGGSIGALVGFALGKPESIARVLSKMDDKEELHMARIAIQVARERNLDFVEQVLAKAILDNPAKARSFLVDILKVKKLNFEEYS